MSLNIKNEETHRRVRELAQLAGETMTEAVDRAVVERLERIRKKRNKARLVERMLEIGHECAKLQLDNVTRKICCTTGADSPNHRYRYVSPGSYSRPRTRCRTLRGRNR